MERARARVEYKGGLSYSKGSRTFVRGQPQIITDPHEIAALKATAGFTVSMLDEPKKEKVEPAPTKKVKQSAQPPEADDEADDEVGDEGDSDDDAEDEDDAAL